MILEQKQHSDLLIKSVSTKKIEPSKNRRYYVKISLRSAHVIIKD